MTLTKTLLLLLPTLAATFDAGHHADLIANALSLKGYAEFSVNVAQEHAWLVDYYGVFHSDNSSAVQLHFVQQESAAAVRAYFDTVRAAMVPLIEEMVTNDQRAEFMGLLGVTLHTVQNFYSHSNFVAKNPRKDCDCFNGNTYFSGGERTDVVTDSLASLGSYCNGTNKESYARDAFEEAYAAAFLASLEWIDIVENLAHQFNVTAITGNNQTYPDLAHLPPPGRDETIYTSVETDLYYMYRISEWTVIPQQHNSGRWKGPHSGSLLPSDIIHDRYDELKSLFFRKRFSAGGAPWSILAQAVKDAKATNDEPSLDKANGTVVIDFKNLKAVIVRTHKIESKGGGEKGNTVDTPDYYAELFMNAGGLGEQLYREATQRDFQVCEPAWSTIYFVQDDVDQIPIEYTLKDESGFEQRTDSAVRIKGEKTTISFSVKLSDGTLSGDLTGKHTDKDSAITVEGTPGMKAGQIAAKLTLSVRVVSVDAACTGTKDLQCHVPGEQVCAERDEGYIVLSNAGLLSASLPLLAASMAYLSI